MAASDLEIKVKKTPGTKETLVLKISAEKIGRLLAQKAQARKVSSVVFDRGSYKYHGLVKALAEGVRKGGLKI